MNNTSRLRISPGQVKIGAEIYYLSSFNDQKKYCKIVKVNNRKEFEIYCAEDNYTFNYTRESIINYFYLTEPVEAGHPLTKIFK